jgi:cytochrome P450
MDFDYLDPAVQSNPMEFLQVLRHQAPVYKEPRTGSYIVTRAKDVQYVADHPELFSNYIDPSVFLACQGLSLEQKDPEVAAILKAKAWLVPHTLLLTDPPVHGRYRRLALEALSPKAVKSLVPFVERTVERFIQPFDSGETRDFVAEFCERVPLSTILHFTGAPESDYELINGWTHQFFSTLMGQGSREEYLKTVHTICDLFNYVARRVDEVKKNPDGTLIDNLLHAHEGTDDAALTLEEILSMFQVLLLAGHDTTRQTLGNGVMVLATRPELFRQLQQHPEQVGGFIEETIRMYSPSNLSSRVAAEDTELAGIKIPKGASLFVSWGSANRDEERFAHANEFTCPNEAGKEHFGFGAGAHFCVGSRLARLTLSTSFNAMLNRYESITLAVPAEELKCLPAINLRALLSLPIRCTLKH